MAKQKPAYYKMGDKYVALNRAAKKLFKKKKIPYVLPIPINLKDIIKRNSKK